MKQRSKRLLSVLLTLVMLLGMVPGMTLDARATDGNVAKIDSTEYANLQDALNAAGNGDTIVLLEDVTENVNVALEYETEQVFDSSKNQYETKYTKKTATLDLAGHGITAKSEGSVITLTQGVLTVTDSTVMDQDTGNDITHYYYIDAESGLARIDDTQKTDAYLVAATKGSFTGGYITGGHAENGGGVYVYLPDAPLNMLAGTIIGNTATSGGGAYVTGDVTLGSKAVVCYNTATKDGGGVWKGEGAVTLDGVNIHHNASGNGGGVFVEQGELFIRNGTAIAQNTAKKAGETGGKGGGIYVDGEDEEECKRPAHVILRGGASVTNNTAGTAGGGVYVDGEISVGDTTATNAVVAHNTVNSADNNVYLASGKKILMAGREDLHYQLSEGTNIGITLAEGADVFTDRLTADQQSAYKNESNALTGYFFSDNPSYGVLPTEEEDEAINQLKLGLPGPYTMNPVLLPGGRIAFMGGRPGLDEYYPIASAFILHTEPLPEKSRLPWLLGLLCGILFASALVLIALRLSRKSARKEPESARETVFTDMMTRIQTLMEEKELFKRPDLKVEDLAAELGTNVAYVRGCISGTYGGSFKSFVNEYRIRYVQRLLKENPNAKITALAEDAGFSSNATFYRNFTAITGLSPAAWLKQQP